MAEERKGFTYYRSFRDAIKELPIEERLQVHESISDYALDGVEPNMDKMSSAVRMAWRLIRPYLEADRTRWDNGCKGGKYGYLGGAPQGNQNARRQTETTPKQPRNNPETTPTPLYNVNVNENVNEDRERKSAMHSKERSAQNMRFTPPTLEEIKDFIVANGYTMVDAEVFYNHYTAIGWKVGKASMKDWRAAVRGWHSREKKNAPQVVEATQPQHCPRPMLM